MDQFLNWVPVGVFSNEEIAQLVCTRLEKLGIDSQLEIHRASKKRAQVQGDSAVEVRVSFSDLGKARRYLRQFPPSYGVVNINKSQRERVWAATVVALFLLGIFAFFFADGLITLDVSIVALFLCNFFALLIIAVAAFRRTRG